LFIHSKKDDYILPSMTEALYQKKKGPKKLFLAENGAHAQSLNENKAYQFNEPFHINASNMLIINV